MGKSNELHTCEHQKTSWGRPVGKPCGKSAKYHEKYYGDGFRWLCGTHAPSAKRVRQEKRDEAFRQQWEARGAVLRRERAIVAAKEAIVAAAVAAELSALPAPLQAAVEALRQLSGEATCG